MWEVLWSLACLVRTGWMQRGVPPALGESVALHSFYSAVLAYEIGVRLKKRGLNVNPERAALIALYHDFGEAKLGDIPKWSSDRAKEVKEALEREAIEELKEVLEGWKLSMEYMEGTTEAKVAKVAETLATYFQAEKYVEMGMKRVEEIRESMRESLMKMAEEMGEPLRELLRDILGSA
ncbi:HD domain-containing protein [Ignicoccus islandicus]|uniref:HD domain-containing protein n=1 Tax=Ignicoccus islandicus TaxID=54259 RepID=UPI001F38C045|nr:HD family hydrolase [Ignicoccus islandicus]